MCKNVLGDLRKKLLPCNTKLATQKYTKVFTWYAHRLLPLEYNKFVIYYSHKGTNM